MTCPRCYGGAVVPTPMRGSDDVSLYTCSGCGLRWSDEPCGTRRCPDRAVSKCRVCEAFRCKGHGVGRSGVCDACKRKDAQLLKPPVRRGGSWERTGRLHQ